MTEALQGPWTVTPGARPHQTLVTTEGESSGDRMVVALCEGGPRRANAILVAASPSLRDALTRMVNELESQGTVGPDTLRQARAALARAESGAADRKRTSTT